MGTKVTVTDLTNIDNASSVATVNTNFDTVADEFDDVHYRDGSLAATGNWDMDSKRLLNLPAPITAAEPVRLQDVIDSIPETALSLLLQSVLGADYINTSTGESVQEILDRLADFSVSRAELKAIDPTATNNGVALMTEANTGGVFTLQSGAIPTADPLEGIYIASNTAGYYWARSWDGVYAKPEWWGAAADDSTDSTAAFSAADTFGATLLLSPGIYRLSEVVLSNRVTFAPGAQIRRTAGLIDFDGGIEAPVERIFLDAVGSTQIDIDPIDTPEGWVDWFGTDADAIETACDIFKVIRFSARNYVVTRTVVIDHSNKWIQGMRGSAEGTNNGTRIILTGAAAVTDPIMQIGTGITTAGAIPASVSRRLHIDGLNTFRDGTITPAVSGKRQDAVPGWDVSGFYESSITHCFDYGSPIGFKIEGVCQVDIEDCATVRPSEGTATGDPDYATAFVVGGYSTSFGFIGANASLKIKNCRCAGLTGLDTMGIYLYGYIGDTWIEHFENSQVDYGIYVDGADAAGTTLTAQSAHQDVRIDNCVLDALDIEGLTVTNINSGGGIQLNHNYIALPTTGKALHILGSDGNISIQGGELIGQIGIAGFGAWFQNSKRIHASGLLIKNFYRAMQLDNIELCHLEPVINRTSSGSSEAIYASAALRCYLAPAIDGAANSWTYGINSTAGTTYTEINLTKIDFGSLSTTAATHKLWYDGATWGGGGTFGTGNIATGVLN